MIVKIHKTKDSVVMALCDSDLIGKKFEDDKRQIDLESRFYRGTEQSKEKILALFKSVHIVNAVGKESITILLENNLVQEENIITIDNIPHVQVVIN